MKLSPGQRMKECQAKSHRRGCLYIRSWERIGFLLEDIRKEHPKWKEKQEWRTCLERGRMCLGNRSNSTRRKKMVYGGRLTGKVDRARSWTVFLNCLVCHLQSLRVILQVMGSKPRFVGWSWTWSVSCLIKTALMAFWKANIWGILRRKVRG